VWEVEYYSTCTGAQYVALQRKLDEEMSNMPLWQNGFGPAFLHMLQRLVEGTAKLETCC
jgi:hypothetical protein